MKIRIAWYFKTIKRKVHKVLRCDVSVRERVFLIFGQYFVNYNCGEIIFGLLSLHAAGSSFEQNNILFSQFVSRAESTQTQTRGILSRVFGSNCKNIANLANNILMRICVHS